MAITKADMEGRTIEALIPDLAPVNVRVLKKGRGQISTGKHDPVTGDELYDFGDIFTVAKNIADELEERGFVEIQETEVKRGPGRPPKADADVSE